LISLEQVRQLDTRVKKAVTAVRSLTLENADLKRQITELETQLDTLRREASDRKADEKRLEVSFQGLIDVLDGMDEGSTGFVSVPVEPQMAAGNTPEPEKTDPGLHFPTDVSGAETDETAEKSVLFGNTGKDAVSGNESEYLQQPVLNDDVSGSSDDDEPIEGTLDISESDDAGELPEDVMLDEEEDDSSDRDNKFQSEFDIF
jgi:FtsZ-binding cell division protein ZapB